MYQGLEHRVISATTHFNIVVSRLHSQTYSALKSSGIYTKLAQNIHFSYRIRYIICVDEELHFKSYLIIFDLEKAYNMLPFSNSIYSQRKKYICIESRLWNAAYFLIKTFFKRSILKNFKIDIIKMNIV